MSDEPMVFKRAAGAYDTRLAANNPLTMYEGRHDFVDGISLMSHEAGYFELKLNPQLQSQLSQPGGPARVRARLIRALRDTNDDRDQILVQLAEPAADGTPRFGLVFAGQLKWDGKSVEDAIKPGQKVVIGGLPRANLPDLPATVVHVDDEGAKSTAGQGLETFLDMAYHVGTFKHPNDTVVGKPTPLLTGLAAPKPCSARILSASLARANRPLPVACSADDET